MAMPSTRPTATDIDPASADAGYWLTKPAVASVAAADYDRLWKACGDVLKQRRFTLDRQDYRSGVLTSRALTSKQFFEVWRHDTVTARDTLQSSLGTLRRIVYFDVTRNPDGSAGASPKVVVERYTTEEHRITAVTSYRSLINPTERSSFAAPASIGEPGEDHWYAVGRDSHLEAALVEDLRQRLR